MQYLHPLSVSSIPISTFLNPIAVENRGSTFHASAIFSLSCGLFWASKFCVFPMTYVGAYESDITKSVACIYTKLLNIEIYPNQPIIYEWYENIYEWF